MTISERPAPVTAGELARALATYPEDVPVFTSHYGEIFVEVDGEDLNAWSGVTSAGNWYGDTGDKLHAFFAERRPKEMKR